MGTIAQINNQDVPSGGGITTPSESDTGMLYFEPAQNARSNTIPDTVEHLPADVPSVYKYAIHSQTDIVRLRFGQFHYFGLDSSGVLYSAGYTNQGYIGRAIGSAGSGTELHDFAQCLTGVSKFDAHDQGAWAIKTDGTLWWCGNVSQYVNSGDTGHSTTISNNGWKQYGSDTDWVDVCCWPQYPYRTLAIKGTGSSKYLYACGTNALGGLPVGTTAGTTKPFTRAKSAASTDLDEDFNAGGLDVGYQNGMGVASNGKLYVWGEGTTGVLGSGNTTDNYYATQMGTDTDWSLPFVYTGRNTGLCIKTDGTLYMSTSTSSSLGIQPASANRTYQQVGTDTDYEDFRYAHRTTSGARDVIYAKKNGAWYVNWDGTISVPHAYGSSSLKTPPTTNTWVALNTFLEGNDITTTITELRHMYVNANANNGENLWVCTSTS